MAERQVMTFPDGEALLAAATDRVLEVGRAAITQRGRFRIALAGGSTPKGLYRRLAQRSDALAWERVRFFFGDERSVGPEHPDSNYRMARESLFSPLGIGPGQIHRMRGEEADLQDAARAYEAELKAEFGELPVFDLVLLGMGDDGHTASLFPGTAALQEQARWAVANEVPQLNTWRMTLTYKVLNHARVVLFLVSGPSKAAALKAVLEGPQDRERFPAQGVRLERGELIWMVDAAAAAQLSRRL